MLVTNFDVRGQTGDWTAKDVERDDSFNKESGHTTIVSIQLSAIFSKRCIYVSTIGFPSTVDVLTPS